MSIRPNYQELDATKTPTLIDIAWSVGVYEGEGTVRLCGKTKRGLMAAVVQKDPEILVRLRDWFGGSIQSTKNKSNCCTWNICGDRCRIFMALAYPFLSARRKVQADSAKAIEFLKGISPEGLTIEELKTVLRGFNEKKKANTWNGSNRSDIRKANYQRRKVEDPNFLPNLLAANKAWKEKQSINSSNSEKESLKEF